MQKNTNSGRRKGRRKRNRNGRGGSRREKALQQQGEYVIKKTLSKFEVKDIANILKTEAVDKI